MPILVPAPYHAPPKPRINTIPRRLEFQTIDGTERFEFDQSLNIEIMANVKGLEVPPRETKYTDSGTSLPRIQSIQDQPAETELVTLWRGERGVLAREAVRLRDFLNHRMVDYRRYDGTFDLVSIDEDGVTLKRRCAYKSGLEGDFSGDILQTGIQRLTRLMVLGSVWPYWRGEEWSTGEVRLPIPSSWLSITGQAKFGHQRLSASRVLGRPIPVSVGGKVPSPPILEFHGPFTSAAVTSNSGLSFSVKALGANDSLFIDTGRDRRAELNGLGVNSGAALIQRGAQWLPLLPGGATITVTMIGADPTSSVLVHGTALHESPYGTVPA